MIEILERVDRALRHLVDGVGALLVAAVTALGVAQVFWRYVLGSSLVWSEELIRLLFVWLIFVAAANAPHLRVGLVTDMVGPSRRRILTVLRHVVTIGLLIVVVNGALRLAATFGTDRYTAIDLTRWWYWASAITGGVLWMVLAVSDAVRTLTGREIAE